MKIALIVPYFGVLPNYFQFFLNSCKINPRFHWLIFTNDNTKYDYPDNVIKINMTFSECYDLVQSKFDFPVSLSKPQKLCDYKCAYGFIFSDYLNDYDWWGHCDLDQIFGNLSNFITEEMLEKYDKLFSLGHLSLYRNTDCNNRLFLSDINGKARYKEVFSTDKGCAFDEWLYPENINEIYLHSKSPIMLDNIGADINPYKTTFQTVDYNLITKYYEFSSISNSIFEMSDGHLYQLYMDNKKLVKKEFPYVHLQKRKMKDNRSILSNNEYYIIPNKFIDRDKNPEHILNNLKIFKIFNYQFFFVKFQSLKYRIINSDWNFTNIFKK